MVTCVTGFGVHNVTHKNQHLERNFSWYILENWGRVRCYKKGHHNPSHSDSGRREKINLNFYFHTLLWWLKKFYESHRTFGGTTKKCDKTI